MGEADGADEVDDLHGPDATGVPGGPPGLLTDEAVARQQQAAQPGGAQVEPQLQPLDRGEQLPRLEVPLAEHLVAVVPTPLVGLHDRPPGLLAGEAGPCVRRDVHGVEVVAVVHRQRAPGLAEAGPRLVAEADDVADDRVDAMLAQQPAGFDVVARGGAFAHLFDDGRVGGLDAHEHVEQARLAVAGHDVGVADDVGGAERGEQVHVHVALDQRFEQAKPEALVRGRVFVGEGDEADAVYVVEVLDFVGQCVGIATPPLDPEAVLPAVGAAVRAAAGELDDGRPALAEAGVAVPVVDQLPAGAVAVEVGDRRAVGRADDVAGVIAEGDTRYVVQRVALLQGAQQGDRRGFAFATDDDVHGRLFPQHHLVVVRGEHAAVDARHAPQCRFDRREHRYAHRMRRRTARMPAHHHRRPNALHVRDNLRLAESHRFGIQQRHVKARIAQRAADH
ncbi:MAG: hypothetical protein WDZ31_10645 [Phycisphaeraceae bacterium]